ncbi:MAG: hypothetical protein AB2A00_00800 [Myxococcota bacterium]
MKARGLVLLALVVAPWWVAAQADKNGKPPPPPPAQPVAPSPDGGPAASVDGGAPAPKAVPASVFESGVKAFNRGNYGEAAGKFFQYIQGNEPAATFYDWSEYYLGRSLRAGGLNHAGDEYLYNVAKARSRPELVPDALRGIEEDIRTGVYDEELLIKDLIAGSEFGDQPNDVTAFIQFYQGVADLRDRNELWARGHFERIPPGTRYTAQAQYVIAVQELARGNLEKARELFTEAAEDPRADLKTRNNAHRALARMAFEEKDYLGAIKKYGDVKVPFLSEEEATIFLEIAWARYHLKDYRGALAILISLDAPSYRQAYFPERWILEALIYKSLCHYAASKSSAREFTRRYGDALKAVREQRSPLAHPVIRNAALQSPVAGRRLAHLKRLNAERDRLSGFSTSADLSKHLKRLYDLKVKEGARLLEEDLEKEAKRVAEELLDFEEQARLVDYEVGLEVFRRVPQAARRATVESRSSAPPLGGHDVHYVFDGEYWNDELHDYQVSIEDRCFAEGLFK